MELQQRGARSYPSAMSLTVEDLEAEALNLSTDKRARLVERLLASFEPEPRQAEWLQVAQRRREDVEAGRAQLVPGDEALARVKARIA